MTRIINSRTRIEGEPLMFLLAVVLSMRLTSLPDGFFRMEALCRQPAGEAFKRAHERVTDRIAKAESGVQNSRPRPRSVLKAEALSTLIVEVLDALPPTERAQVAQLIAPAVAAL